MLIFAYFTGCRRCRCESGGDSDDGHGVAKKRNGHVELNFADQRPRNNTMCKIDLFSSILSLYKFFYFKGRLFLENIHTYFSSSN